MDTFTKACLKVVLLGANLAVTGMFSFFFLTMLLCGGSLHQLTLYEPNIYIIVFEVVALITIFISNIIYLCKVFKDGA